MDAVCSTFFDICGADLHSGQGGDRGSEFQSGDGGADGRCAHHGLGNGISHRRTVRASSIGKKSWIFLILSGLATGASWLCYYKALQMGDASKVVPIDKMSVVITLILAFVFLHESVTPKTVLGCVLIGAGTLLMVL